MKALPSLIKGSRRAPLLRLVLTGLAQGALGFALVLLFARLGTHPAEPVGTVIGLVGMAAALGVLRALETLEAERLGQAYVRALRRRLFEALEQSSATGPVPRNRGSLWLRLTSDLNGLRRWVGTGVARSIAAGSMLSTLSIALLLHTPALALALIAALVPLAVAMAFSQRRLLQRETELRRKRARLAGSVDRWLTALAMPSRPAPAALRLLKRRSRRVAESAVDRARLHAVVRGIAEFSPLAAGAGAVLLLRDAPPGGLFSILALCGLIAGPIRDLALAWEMRLGYRVAAANVGRLLQAPGEPPPMPTTDSRDADPTLCDPHPTLRHP